MQKDQATMTITVYEIIATLCNNLLQAPAQKQKLTDAEVITIAVCAALFFNSNQEKALIWLQTSGYFPQMLSVSRFNRRVHRLKDFIEYCFESVS